LYEYKFSELADSNYDHDPKRHSPLVLTQRVNPRPTARFGFPGKTYNFCVATEGVEDVIPVTMTGVPPFHLEVEIKHSGNSNPDWISLPNILSPTYNLRIPPKYLREGHSSVTIKKVRDSRGCQSRPENAQIRPKVQVSVHDAPTISPLETQTDFCVGEYLSFQLSGSAPFEVHYTFENKARKAAVSSTLFKRVADNAGIFTIDAVSDSASQCKASVPSLQKIIHPRPRGTLSKGRLSRVDIHEGGETDIVFDFEGAPPFEFTYTRSTEPRKGQRQVVLETKTERTEERSVTRKVSSEGEYELISVKDAFCISRRDWSESGKGKAGQKMLMN
jgi:nucleoporin POM152